MFYWYYLLVDQHLILFWGNGEENKWNAATCWSDWSCDFSSAPQEGGIWESMIQNDSWNQCRAEVNISRDKYNLL